jgi:hypothetical protein
VVIAVVAARGGSGSTASHQTFCGDLDTALPELNNGNIVHVTQGGDSDPYTADEKSTMRTAITSAKHLAGEAPDVPKRYLDGLARGLAANLAGREDLDVDDDVDVQLGQLSAWDAVNCT